MHEVVIILDDNIAEYRSLLNWLKVCAPLQYFIMYAGMMKLAENDGMFVVSNKTSG